MGAIKFHSVALPFQPPIDKVCAMAVAELSLGYELDVHTFWAANECPNEQLRSWEAEGVLPIDLGIEKYHGQAGSATEFLVRKLSIPETQPLRILLARLAKNNADGYLKTPRLAVAWTLRELYEFEEYSQRDVIRQAIHVVKMWFWTQENEPVAGRSVESFEAEPALAVLREAVGQQYRDDFTVAQHCLHHWLAGASPEEIRGLAEFWITGDALVRRLVLEARERFDREYGHHPDEFVIRNGGDQFRCRWLASAQSHEVKAASRRYDVLVAKHPKTGHVSIMTAGLDVSNVCAELERREPGRWNLSAGNAINGGRIYQAERATEGTKEGFRFLLRKFPPRRKSSSRSRR